MVTIMNRRIVGRGRVRGSSVALLLAGCARFTSVDVADDEDGGAGTAEAEAAEAAAKTEATNVVGHDPPPSSPESGVAGVSPGVEAGAVEVETGSTVQMVKPSCVEWGTRECAFECTTGVCVGRVLECPAGRPCLARCGGGAGQCGELHCAAGQPCAVECVGAAACDGVKVEAAAASRLCVRCIAGAGAACENMACVLPTKCSTDCLGGGCSAATKACGASCTREPC